MKIIVCRGFSYNDNMCVLVRLHYLGALHELFCVLGSEQSHALKKAQEWCSVLFIHVANAYLMPSYETWRPTFSFFCILCFLVPRTSYLS
jgi:hypothetical protein